MTTRKKLSLALIIICPLTIFLLYMDMRENQLFTKEGARAKAVVTEITKLIDENAANPAVASTLDQYVVTYSYSVNKTPYTGSGKWPADKDVPEKEDIIRIEYLKNNAAISRVYQKPEHNPYLIYIMMTLVGSLLLGILMWFWPEKKTSYYY